MKTWLPWVRLCSMAMPHRLCVWGGVGVGGGGERERARARASERASERAREMLSGDTRKGGERALLLALARSCSRRDSTPIVRFGSLLLSFFSAGVIVGEQGAQNGQGEGENQSVGEG